MSVTRAMALRAEIAELMNKRVPLPSTAEDHTDRMQAAMEVLIHEVLSEMRWRIPALRDCAIPDTFVEGRLDSFWSNLFLPWALDRAKDIPIDSQVKH